MAKGRRGGRKGGARKEVVYDSDDERSYARERVPDPKSNEFYHDAIDDFHDDQDKILLNRGEALEPADISSDEQEGVLDIASDSSDEEIEGYKRQLRQMNRQGFKEKMGSDVEEEGEDDEGLPDDKAWGKNRNKYYGADVDGDVDIDSEDEQAAAALEEKEALAIQQRLAQQLDEGDFGLDIFTAAETDKSTEEKTEQKIEKDLSKLTKKEKMKLLKKESPELLELIEDYKAKMTELSERLVPIHKQIKSGVLPVGSSAARYVTTKVKLCLNYCTNISFYMMLKAKKTPVHNHPVITRLLQYRNLLKQLESADEKIAPLLDETLEKIQNGEAVIPEPESPSEKTVKQSRKKRKLAAPSENKKRLSEMLEEPSSDEEEDTEEEPKARKRKKEAYMTDAEKEALRNYDMMKGRGPTNESEEEDESGEEAEDEEIEGEGGEERQEWVEEEGGEGEKRPINYQIAKNKGLTSRKKKENRNPRVKHRRKFRKALIRRKGQVRTVRTEMTRYSGEASGIRSGIIASRKLKA